MSEENINKQEQVAKRFRQRNQREKNDVVQFVEITDETIVDLVLRFLFNQGNKRTASLADDILAPLNIQFTENGFDRIWDVLVGTNLVSPVIGFGRSGKLSITHEGLQIMTQFGSYANFIQLRAAAAQQQMEAAQKKIEAAENQNAKSSPQKF